VPWDVLFFSSVDFASHAQRPQAVARELAECGARVLYVDNLGLRLPRLTDRKRLVRRVRSARAKQETTSPITVLSPIVPPIEHWASVRTFTRRWLLTRVQRWRTDRPLVVWTYLPNPIIGEVADATGAEALVYEYADLASVRLRVHGERQRYRVAAWEEQMFARADAVFVPTQRLLDVRGVKVPHAHVVPHAPPTATPGPTPQLSAEWPHPRIAFVGSISPVVDLALLDALAAQNPLWSFVIAGPARVPLRQLARRPNVRIMGERTSEEVATLLGECDVGIIPYLRSTRGLDTVSPLKLHDYLARGLPVVSVDIPEVRGFDDVEVASGVSGFAAAIQRALERGRGPGRVAGSWADAVGEMVQQVRKYVPS
jgi:glycosyltransferase involved in cell wall biosynthesis